MSEIRYVCRRTDDCRCSECEVQWLNKEVLALRTALAEAQRERDEAEARVWSKVWCLIDDLGITGSGCPDIRIVNHIRAAESRALAAEAEVKTWREADGGKLATINEWKRACADITTLRAALAEAQRERDEANALAEGWMHRVRAAETRALAAEAEAGRMRAALEEIARWGCDSYDPDLPRAPLVCHCQACIARAALAPGEVAK